MLIRITDDNINDDLSIVEDETSVQDKEIVFKLAMMDSKILSKFETYLKHYKEITKASIKIKAIDGILVSDIITVLVDNLTNLQELNLKISGMDFAEVIQLLSKLLTLNKVEIYITSLAAISQVGLLSLCENSNIVKCEINDDESIYNLKNSPDFQAVFQYNHLKRLKKAFDNSKGSTNKIWEYKEIFTTTAKIVEHMVCYFTHGFFKPANERPARNIYKIVIRNILAGTRQFFLQDFLQKISASCYSVYDFRFLIKQLSPLFLDKTINARKELAYFIADIYVALGHIGIMNSLNLQNTEAEYFSYVAIAFFTLAHNIIKNHVLDDKHDIEDLLGRHILGLIFQKQEQNDTLSSFSLPNNPLAKEKLSLFSVCLDNHEQFIVMLKKAGEVLQTLLPLPYAQYFILDINEHRSIMEALNYSNGCQALINYVHNAIYKKQQEEIEKLTNIQLSYEQRIDKLPKTMQDENIRLETKLDDAQTRHTQAIE